MQTAKRFLLEMFFCGTVLAFSPAARAAGITSFDFEFGGEPGSGWPHSNRADEFLLRCQPVTVSSRARTWPAPAVASPATNPFYFSVKLPEGNYRVTAALGDRRRIHDDHQSRIAPAHAGKNPRPAPERP